MCNEARSGLCATVSTAPKEKADVKMSKNKKKKMKKKMKKKQQLLEQQRLQLEELERGQVCLVCVILFEGKELFELFIKLLDMPFTFTGNNWMANDYFG